MSALNTTSQDFVDRIRELRSARRQSVSAVAPDSGAFALRGALGVQGPTQKTPIPTVAGLASG